MISGLKAKSDILHDPYFPLFFHHVEVLADKCNSEEAEMTVSHIAAERENNQCLIGGAPAI
jgi:hypothetical protein